MPDEPEDEPAAPPIVHHTAPQPPEDEANWELFEAQEQAKKLRALFAARLYVEPVGDHVRLSFGEVVSNETVYHTALMVPAETAVEMAQLIYRIATGAIDAKMDRLRRFMAAHAQPDREDPNG